MKKGLIAFGLILCLILASCSSGTYLTPYANTLFTDTQTTAGTSMVGNAPSQNPTGLPPNFITYWVNYAYFTIQNGSTWYGFKMLIWSNSASYVGEFTDVYQPDGHYGMGPIGPGINVASFDFLEPTWAAFQTNNHTLDNGPYPSSNFGPHSILNEPYLGPDAIRHEPDLSAWGHFNLDPIDTWKISLMAKLTPDGNYENIPFRGMPAAHSVVPWPSN